MRGKVEMPISFSFIIYISASYTVMFQNPQCIHNVNFEKVRLREFSS